MRAGTPLSPQPRRPARRVTKRARRRARTEALLRLALLAACACLLLAALGLVTDSFSGLDGLALPGGPGAAPGGADQAFPLPVEPVLQNPELPNGCEAASLAALLRYQGFSVTASELAQDWLPRQDFTYSGQDRCGPDPESAYAGDPFSAKNGWYCFEGPVVEAANAYLKAQGSALSARALAGAAPEELLAELQAGRPVAVWFTQDYAPPRRNPRFSWTLPNGGSYQPWANLHCLVLTGMDKASCTFADPLRGAAQVERAVFDEVYTAMGCRAVVLA